VSTISRVLLPPPLPLFEGLRKRRGHPPPLSGPPFLPSLYRLGRLAEGFPLVSAPARPPLPEVRVPFITLTRLSFTLLLLITNFALIDPLQKEKLIKVTPRHDVSELSLYKGKGVTLLLLFVPPRFFIFHSSAFPFFFRVRWIIPVCNPSLRVFCLSSFVFSVSQFLPDILVLPKHCTSFLLDPPLSFFLSRIESMTKTFYPV